MAPARREGRGFRQQPLPQLRADVHQMIGRQLRLHYEELQQQPLPERLMDLLDELDRSGESPPGPRRN